MNNDQDDPSEEWRPIPEFPDYEASNLGRIRSFKWGYWRSIRPGHHKRNGYLLVCLRVNKRYVTRSVHRLITAAFLGPAGDRDVNHKNGDKHDNRICNLEYLSRGDNHRHAYRTGLREPVGKRLTDDEVRSILALKGAATQKELGQRFGVSDSTIGAIHLGKLHSRLLVTGV